MLANKEAGDDLISYFERAQKWEYDALKSSNNSRKIAWTIAFIAGICLIVALFLLVIMLPLKEIKPYLVVIDKSSGFIQMPEPLEQASPAVFNDVLRRSTLANYVRSYQGYSRAELDHNFSIVSAMSTATVQSAYSEFVSPNDENSPQKKYADLSQVNITILSVYLLSEELATVQYRRDVVDIRTGGVSEPPSFWGATIEYEYMPEKDISFKDQILNPTRFLVKKFRVDPVTQK